MLCLRHQIAGTSQPQLWRPIHHAHCVSNTWIATKKKLFKSICHPIAILFIVEKHYNKSNLVILRLDSFSILPKAPNCGQKSTATWGRYITRRVAPHTPSRSNVPIMVHQLYEKNISQIHSDSGPPHLTSSLHDKSS